MARVFLTDFGLAQDTATGSKFTRSGTTLGTPAYMSPEQARGEVGQLTPASDVWGLGCVLYEMLSGGRRAFAGETPAAVIGAVLTQSPEALPSLPPPVRDFVGVMLQRVAEHRYQAAGVLASDARRVLSGERPLARPRRLGGWSAPAVAVAAVVVAGVAGWLALRHADAPARPEAGNASSSVADAEAQAERWWGRRAEGARAAAEGIAALLDRLPDPDGWRLRIGLLRWAGGEVHDAGSDDPGKDWLAVDANGPHAAEAQLLMGIEHLCRAFETSRAPGCTAEHFRNAESGGGVLGRIAQAGARMRQSPEAALQLLEGIDRWEADALRARAWTDAAEPDYAQAAAALDRVEAALGPAGWTWCARAATFRRLDQPERAREAAEHAVRLAPRLPGPHRQLGLALLEAGEPRAALDAMQEAVRLAPRNAYLYLDRAAAFLALDEANHAEREWSRAMQLAPNDVGVSARIGEQLVTRRRYREAMQYLDAAVALGAAGDDPWILEQRAQALLALSRPREALADADALEAARPGWVWAAHLRGRALEALGDPAGALAAYDTALQRDPTANGVAVSRMSALAALGRPAEALAQWTALSAETRRSFDARFTRVRVLQRMPGREAEVRAELEALLTEHPDNGDVLLSLANVYLAHGDMEHGAELLERARKVCPEHFDVLTASAMLALRRGDLPGGIARLSDALNVRPDNAGCLANRGIALRMSGNPGAALADLERATELEPERAPIWIQLADVYIDLERLDDAVRATTQGCQHAPQSYAAWFAHGRALAIAERWAEAGPAYRRALALDPDAAARDQTEARAEDCEERAAAAKRDH